MLYINDSIPTKHLHWENVWNICERAERASFKNLAFSHSNTAISLNNLLVLQILCFRNIFNFRCQHSPYIYNHQINAVSFYYSWYGAIYKRQYTDKTLTLRKCMCMRASEASELRKFRYFTFLNCYFFRYFVGTSDALSVQMTCLSAYMYRQIYQCTDKFPNVPTKVRKDIIGGGGGAIAPPPAPPLATLMLKVPYLLLLKFHWLFLPLFQIANQISVYIAHLTKWNLLQIIAGQTEMEWKY